MSSKAQISNAQLLIERDANSSSFVLKPCGNVTLCMELSLEDGHFQSAA